MAIPKVFVSYSHDSPDHKKWVMEIATKLINNGVDVILDQWELKAGADIALFMERYIKDSDYVLMICTEKYVEKANAGKGGVGYERMIITADLIKDIDSTKFIPIIKQAGTHKVPAFLGTKLFTNISGKDFEFNYDELVRTIHGTPLYEKPNIGNNPFGNTDSETPKKSRDAIKELMIKVVADYESGSDWSNRSATRDNLGISRIMFDILVNEARTMGLIGLDSSNDILLTSTGKSYAVENGLVK